MQYPPLRERVFRGSCGTAAVTATEERGSYKQWSGGQMDRAVKAVVCDKKKHPACCNAI